MGTGHSTTNTKCKFFFMMKLRWRWAGVSTARRGTTQLSKQGRHDTVGTKVNGAGPGRLIPLYITLYGSKMCWELTRNIGSTVKHIQFLSYPKKKTYTIPPDTISQDYSDHSNIRTHSSKTISCIQIVYPRCV